ncbi:FAD binding domain-containing protein [Aurantimonas endophytica]|uniref:Xanthine dehydrogenase YagS FAD-binding subunit n=1 Tax=Aurantimonas endophytica TaxID=1522175 RepID=A0A7W6HEX0_9HYPH|nr:xanthine dehydrogenase family protein subunit M [Aurantimonas endophytica]MBB4003673.1 xanthine dehydrogenase YagS FAD-binding subunit [Aurantimonas endophytica]MCO6404529.1 xanthine dehydrogenase family protein subunit M [Aurantimonas endophytica]
MQPFSYYRAETANDVVSALSGGARILAGGTTLYDLMKLDVEHPERVVDISALDLTEIRMEGETLVLGALARMSDAVEHEILRTEFPALRESLWRAASQQLRNMATLGGNLLQRTRCSYFRHGAPYACNKRQPGSGCAAVEGLNRAHALFGGSDACIAIYPGDFATALMAFDAEIDLLGPSGTRRIPLASLHREPEDNPERETNLEPDEFITAIRVPRSNAARASTYHKIRDRESYAFALVSSAVGLDLDGDIVRDARIALGGVATRPWRAGDAERLLVGRPLTEATAREAGVAAFAGASTTQHNAFKTELGARAVADALMIAKTRI